MSAQVISPDDPRLIWNGAISVQRGPGWVMPWRLPHEDLEFFPPEALQAHGSSCSGVRLRFATDADTVTFVTEPMPNGGNLDLFACDEHIATITFAQGSTEHTAALPGGMRTIELWPHQTTLFKLRGIRIPDTAVVDMAFDDRPRWITYGSSITHCGAAGSPAFTWPGVVARAMNLNLTSLGFGGQCHADPMIARMIRDLPADFISVKLGINIYGAGSLSQRSFLPAVIGVIATIREKHPDIPFVVCSPIWSPPREDVPNAVGMTLQIMREEVEAAVKLFQDRGDAHLYYVNGLNLFGPELADHLPDELHPDAKGYVMMGENFVREVFDQIGITLPRKTLVAQ